MQTRQPLRGLPLPLVEYQLRRAAASHLVRSKRYDTNTRCAQAA
jgi:hypothetical protein